MRGPCARPLADGPSLEKAGTPLGRGMQRQMEEQRGTAAPGTARAAAKHINFWLGVPTQPAPWAHSCPRPPVQCAVPCVLCSLSHAPSHTPPLSFALLSRVSVRCCDLAVPDPLSQAFLQTSTSACPLPALTGPPVWMKSMAIAAAAHQAAQAHGARMVGDGGRWAVPMQGVGEWVWVCDTRVEPGGRSCVSAGGGASGVRWILGLCWGRSDDSRPTNNALCPLYHHPHPHPLPQWWCLEGRAGRRVYPSLTGARGWRTVTAAAAWTAAGTAARCLPTPGLI